MMHSKTVSVLATLAAISLTPNLEAQNGGAKNKGTEVRVPQSVGFSSAERQIIVEFFAMHQQQEAETLPPGIAKRPIPSGLQAQLPARVGVEVSIFGDRIVLLEASGLVVDILEGVFR